MEEVDAEMLSQESTHCYDSLLCELLGMYFMDNIISVPLKWDELNN